tara:strand:- start:25048 stop:25185 length:138 start_codon:yes stop_codon:yes gene_type:complete
MAEWYFYLIGLAVFLVPGLISTYKQVKTGYSLERLELVKRPFRAF